MSRLIAAANRVCGRSTRQVELVVLRGSIQLESRKHPRKRLARYGDVAGIRAYVYGHGFLAAFNGLEPERRHSAMLVYAKAVAECEARARLPLAAPIALNARTIRETGQLARSSHVGETRRCLRASQRS